MRSRSGPETGLIVGGTSWRAATRQRGIAKMAAPAWAHRRDELDARREGDVRVRPGNADRAGLERLPKRIQHGALEFRKLVEE